MSSITPLGGEALEHERTFTGSGDGRRMSGPPTTRGVDGAADRAEPRPTVDPSHRLLTHCFALGATIAERPPARLRLEAKVGPDLARRLLASLTRVDRA
jgi:hypothetical protein